MKVSGQKFIAILIFNQNLVHLGMLHAGIGPSHVNALLTSINIPPVSQSTFKAREREVGPAIEELAKASCEEAMEVEKECWRKEAEEVVSIGASYDMGWQKRGKGHNSLTGLINYYSNQKLLLSLFVFYFLVQTTRKGIVHVFSRIYLSDYVCIYLFIYLLALRYLAGYFIL